METQILPNNFQCTFYTNMFWGYHSSGYCGLLGVTPCSLVGRKQCFEGICSCHLQGQQVQVSELAWLWRRLQWRQLLRPKEGIRKWYSIQANRNGGQENRLSKEHNIVLRKKSGTAWNAFLRYLCSFPAGGKLDLENWEDTSSQGWASLPYPIHTTFLYNRANSSTYSLQSWKWYVLPKYQYPSTRLGHTVA